MSILETIVQAKVREVSERKSVYPVSFLERSYYFATQCVSMNYYLEAKDGSGIIAEFKRKSPSRGWINRYAKAQEVIPAYRQAGAAGLSVLTDEVFFGAQRDDFLQARDLNYGPILRKDFIIDEYQIIESKSMGADVILLISKILKPGQVEAFTSLAQQLGMEVLLEMQDKSEVLEHMDTKADLLGINNRNLVDFSVDLENSMYLASLLPPGKTKIAESGIQSAEDICRLRQAGFQGFLIGTQFMTSSNPAQSCKKLIKGIAYEN